MRTMASVWFTVIVLISIQKVFGNGPVCNIKQVNELSCDECIRCDGTWCKGPVSPHCNFSPGDNEWCPNNDDVEYPPVYEVTAEHNDNGILYAEKNLFIRKPITTKITYAAMAPHELKMAIVNSTQSFNIGLRQAETKCNEASCSAVIEATASTDFCNATGGVTESVQVRVHAGTKQVAHITYFVPCACACSQQVVKNSPNCNKNGDFACGACTCHKGWKGEFCEETVCEERNRGDAVQCSLNPRREDDCSGNGYCSSCETCICYTDREGSQYFESPDCKGICDYSSEWEDCLVNNTIGKCYMNNIAEPTLTTQKYNESLIKEKDSLGRKIWVKCADNFDDCGRLEYFASRDDNGRFFVMMVNQCNDISAAAYQGDTNVSMILGILALVAVVAAVGGVMLWKHMNTVPPVPLNDPQYQNIDAEDCTGENPLYKPPTSSFKNPTYGKW